MPRRKKNIVVIGGGTGTAVLLGGLKDYSVNISAVITTADNGSSTGILRKEYGIVPPGDLRKCVTALAGIDASFLEERFSGGFLRGHTIGNIMLAKYIKEAGDAQIGVDRLLRLVNGRGRVYPASGKPLTLVARMFGTKEIIGENNITSSRTLKKKLSKLMLSTPRASANPEAIKAIKRADVIVIGPGNLYCSILPNFLVGGIKKAFLESGAKKIYIPNLFNWPGHTDGFTVSDFLNVFSRYLGRDVFDAVLYNTGQLPRVLEEHHKNKSVGDAVILTSEEKKDPRFIGRKIAKNSIAPKSGYDPIASIRNPFTHDSGKLAKAIMELV